MYMYSYIHRYFDANMYCTYKFSYIYVKHIHGGLSSLSTQHITVADVNKPEGERRKKREELLEEKRETARERSSLKYVVLP